MTLEEFGRLNDYPKSTVRYLLMAPLQYLVSYLGTVYIFRKQGYL